MGRGRIPMEVIEKEKARKTTFEKRKKGLIKKAYEFATLCGVDVGVIIYAPNFLDEPETYPNSIDIKHVIQKYQNTTSDRRPKGYDLREYFNDRMKKIDSDISKVQKENIKIMYPTWDDSYRSLGEEQLRIFVSILDAKLDACNQKMNLIKLDSKGKGIAEHDETLTSYMSQTQLFPVGHHNNNNNHQLEFYPYQFSQTSQPSMFHFPQSYTQSMEKNAMVDWTDQVDAGACDEYMGVLKEDARDKNQNSLLSNNLNMQIRQPYATFQTLPDQVGLSAGLELDNDLYTSNMFQPQLF